MSVLDTLVSRRTYRRFAQKAVPQDVVDDIVEAVRLSSCGANRQAVRLVVVNKPEAVAKLSEHFGSRFSLNAASTPVYTVRLRAGQKMADLAAELGKAL